VHHLSVLTHAHTHNLLNIHGLKFSRYPFSKYLKNAHSILEETVFQRRITEIIKGERMHPGIGK